LTSKKEALGVATDGQKVKVLVDLGIAADLAVEAVKALNALCGGISEARRARNQRWYEGHKEILKEKRKIKTPIKTLSDAFKTVKTTERYLAKIGSPQYDAWNSYKRDTTGKGLPFSDKTNGWEVESEWPPGWHANAKPNGRGSLSATRKAAPRTTASGDEVP
jgi:hypothetical protein